MNIVQAQAADAAYIHNIMLRSFAHYQNHPELPSGALEETTVSVYQALTARGEEALIVWDDNHPAAMVRYRDQEDGIEFFRLSVVPEYRGRGLARRLIREVERRCIDRGKAIVRCKVRAEEKANMKMYRHIGFEKEKQETWERKGTTLEVAFMKKKAEAAAVEEPQ
ncbi:GNAT family N-acetyltransferase [Alkalicoccus chagannorensis]|uniref:GNAT family N-acetyltransferase n=1 Tax=Alkalicoccus chagannorensis TaxID=427072 RepID=UPI00040550A6|nr:GNAT family N-acetyltransferase [Alkalicoccus chagannorensis]